MLRNYRKPLIVVGPKGLLRAPYCQSTLSEMGPGTKFQPVLNDPFFHSSEESSKVTSLCFVSGKLYYDLIKERTDRGLDSEVAFVRLEELNPFPKPELAKVISSYPNVKQYFWVQEEPQNQGSYTFIQPRLDQLLPTALKYHGRKASAAPATGISKVYKTQQQSVVKGIFDKHQ